MKATEINERLERGEKLILHDRAYFPEWYYVGKEEVENRINKNQFEKAKLTCNKSDDSEKHRAFFRGSQYRIYYWRYNKEEKK